MKADIRKSDSVIVIEMSSVDRVFVFITPQKVYASPLGKTVPLKHYQPLRICPVLNLMLRQSTFYPPVMAKCQVLFLQIRWQVLNDKIL